MSIQDEHSFSGMGLFRRCGHDNLKAKNRHTIIILGKSAWYHNIIFNSMTIG